MVDKAKGWPDEAAPVEYDDVYVAGDDLTAVDVATFKDGTPVPDEVEWLRSERIARGLAVPADAP